MSHDVDIVIDTGGEEHSVADFNYTWNCGPMFRIALGEEGINSLHDTTCEAAATRLIAAVEHMRVHPEIYEPLNPSNKWGSYESAMRWLSEIRDACIHHSKCKLKVS